MGNMGKIIGTILREAKDAEINRIGKSCISREHPIVYGGHMNP